MAEACLSPWISSEQIQEMMDDVFGLETTPDKFGSFADHQENMHQFIFLELRKLTKNMLISRLKNSSLSDELERMKSLKDSCDKFSLSIEHFLYGKENLEDTLTSIHKTTYCGSFFQPQTKFSIDISQSIKSATEQFKSIHTTLREEDSRLFL